MSNANVSQRFPRFALSGIRILPLGKLLVSIVLGIAISAGTVPATSLATDVQGSTTGMTETAGIATATVTSEEPSGKATDETDAARRGQRDEQEDEQEGDEGKDGFSPADAVVLSALVVAISLALRSMMRTRMRSCPGSCSLCMGGCHKATKLDEDPILRERLEALHSTNRGSK